jgi:DNA-binding transcriptional LysR family regulator
MDTRLLTSFLAVAERLHFGRAADQLGLSQPALSHQIRRLEEHVGSPLFDRTSRLVTVTDAGHALLPEARRVLIDLERAITQSRLAAEGRAGHLLIGSIGACLNGVTPEVVRRLRDGTPGLAVQLRQMDTPEQLEALRRGELDVAFVRSARGTSGLRVELLFEEPMMVALPSGHPLESAEEVSIHGLSDEAFVLWPRTTSPAFHDLVYRVCRSAGFEPSVAMEGSDIETQLGLVSAGVGISLQPASFARLGRAGVAWRQLAADAPTTSSVQLAWCEPARTPLIASTLKIAHDVVIEQRIARSTSSNRPGPRNQSTVVPGGAVHGG